MQGVIRKFTADESGAVAGLYAVALIGLIAVGGVGFDYARMAGMDSELQNAADQAALAAATQLDGEVGACSRAADAAVNLLENITLLSNDGGGNRITISPSGTEPCPTVPDDVCDDPPSMGENSTSVIVFYKNYENPCSHSGTSGDGDAKVVRVEVDFRTAQYAFTPIVGAISPSMTARAVASIGSAICDVPPLMICDPDPGNVTPIAQRLQPGVGIQVTGHGNNATKGAGGSKDDYDTGGTVSAWAPGDFGFLEIGTGKNEDLIKALAYDELPFDCAPIGGTKPETGNAQGLYDALNTRFDIYDFTKTTSGGNPLAPCNTGSCPAATVVTKDLVNPNVTSEDVKKNGNSCKMHKTQGWKLPPNEEQFWPVAANGDYSGMATYQRVGLAYSITAMGLPRDLCHYSSYSSATGSTCGTGGENRVGNGEWARGDYFKKNHPGNLPPDASTITRYKTYLWEQDAANRPNPGGGQRANPICSISKGGIPSVGRRVLTVAVVTNCALLSGASTSVEIGEWLDMFLVEPIVDERENGSIKDGLYMEVIRVNDLGSGSTTGGTVRKDKPYLIE